MDHPGHDPPPANPATGGTTTSVKFRGYDQPDVNDRLQQAKIFLADEDLYRCDGFKSKLNDIEEYLSVIEREKPQHDVTLFQDVSTMVDVHREWHIRDEKGMPGALCTTNPHHPLIQPFSTRLVSDETDRELHDSRLLQGLENQTRHDRAPFTVDYQNDHIAFRRAFNRDRAINPAAVDENTNLLWVESGAYRWALKDPAMIQHWTHPTKGILKRGIKAGDPQPWYRQPKPPSEAVRARPARGWVPAYLLEFENRVNRLLKNQPRTAEAYIELTDMLSLVEPPAVRKASAKFNAIVHAKEFKYLSSQSQYDEAIAEFGKVQGDWIRTFEDDGIYLIVKRPGGDATQEVDLPGIFYVKDGFHTPRHEANLAEINGIMRDVFLPHGFDEARLGQNSFLLSNLLHLTCPKSIVDMKSQRTHILLRHGANSFDDLTGPDRVSCSELKAEIKRKQLEWENRIRAQHAIFIYLRPGERRPNDDDTYLYLPWHLTELPRPKAIPRLDLRFPMEVDALRERIRGELRTASVTDGDTALACLKRCPDLQEVVYPELRSFLLPWNILRHKVTDENATLDPAQMTLQTNLETVIKPLLLDWLCGIDPERLLVKMPSPDQGDESPTILYWRSPDLNTDPEVQFHTEIELVKTNLATAKPGRGRNWTAVTNALKNFQFPALRRAEEDAAHQGSDVAVGKYTAMLQQWIDSKRHAAPRLKVKVPNGYLDRDDDPSVVYYHGPLPLLGDPSLATSQTTDENLQAFRAQRRALDGLSDDILKGLPHPARLAFNAHKRSPSTELESIVRWYLDTIADESHLEADPTGDDHPRGAYTQHGLAMTETVSNALLRQTTPPMIGGLLLTPDTTPNVPDIRTTDFMARSILSSHTSTRSRTPTQLAMPSLSPQSGSGSAHQHGLYIDLNLIARHTHVIEVELKRLLDIEKPSSAEEERLQDLLLQFMPADVYQAWKDVENLAHRKPSNGANSLLVDPEVSILYNLCSEPYETWICKLRENRTTLIVRSSGMPESSGCFYLVFNRNITHINDQCEIRAPRSLADGTSALKQYRIRDLKPPTLSRTNELRRHVHDLVHGADGKLGIRALLRARQQDGDAFDWDTSEELLHSLRPVMPPHLAILDKQLQAIDTKARQGAMTQLEDIRFWDAWARWHQEYDSWVGGLDAEHLDIVTDSTTQSDNNHVLRLQLDKFWTLPRNIRARDSELPHVVQDSVARLTRLLTSATPLTDEEQEDLVRELHPFWKDACQSLRAQINQYVTSRLHSGFDPDVDNLVLVESILSLCYASFRARFGREKSFRLHVTETRPGEFVPTVTSDAGDESQQSLVDRVAAFSDQTMSTCCHDILIESRKESQRVAVRLRSGALSSDADALYLSRYLLPRKTKAGTIRLYDEAAKAMEDYHLHAQNGTSTDQERDQVIEKDTSCFWHKWLYTYPDIARACLNVTDDAISGVLELKTAVTSKLIDRLLYTPTIEGTGVQPSLANQALPIPFVVKEVEVALNNLIASAREGYITEQESRQLDFVMQGTLDSKFKRLRNELALLDNSYVGEAGLNVNDNLTFTAKLKHFQEEFARVKASVPYHGILLDEWWFSTEDIAEICTRMRHWQHTVQDPDRWISVPTSTTLTSIRMQDLHNTYRNLVKFVENRCLGNDTDEVLVIRVIPQSLIDLKVKIAGFKVPDLINLAFPKDLHSGAHLRAMQTQFIHGYMSWISGLTAAQLKTYRDEAAGTYAGPIDFAPKAERRGIQRAAIELGLNMLATNQEQHRPNDKFRILDLPGPHKPRPQEFPVSIPLEPSRRPLEQDPFDYTKKLLAYRDWKDFDWEAICERPKSDYGDILKVPRNYHGPYTMPSHKMVKMDRQDVLGNLTGIAKILHDAYERAPRPLLKCMLTAVGQAMMHKDDPESLRHHHLWDDRVISQADIDLLRLLAGPSWDEDRANYPADIPGITDTDGELKRMQEFEREVEASQIIPMWSPTRQPQVNEDHRQFDAIIHDPAERSVDSIRLGDLLQSINDERAAVIGPTGETLLLWDAISVRRYLAAMKAAYRIHLDSDDAAADPNKVLVSRIPLSGHPENRFITSRDNVLRFPGVRMNMGKYDVRYDHTGTRGPPTIQPNKNTHLEKLAFRMGRDIVLLLHELAQNNRPRCKEVLKHQEDKIREAEKAIDQAPSGRGKKGAVDPRDITLIKLAKDVLQIAPDLAVEVGIDPHGDLTTRQAVIILQMQLVEEMNNNWEPLFPEKENVWSFAADRVAVKERMMGRRKVFVKPRLTAYFDMRRHPVILQSDTIQTNIKDSGPIVDEKPKPAPKETSQTARRAFGAARAAATQAGLPVKVDRHIRGQRPHFPFGETPYQAAYQSFRMEHDLRNVQDLQSTKPKTKPKASWFSLKRKRDDHSPTPVDQYALPPLPDDFHPSSISLENAHHELVETMKTTPGFPGEVLLEYYHDADEMVHLKRQRAWEARQEEIREAKRDVERYAGKGVEEMTGKEVRDAQRVLGIDAFTGLYLSRIGRGG